MSTSTNDFRIALNVRGGLCNRLNALSCAIALIHSDIGGGYGQRIEAYWEPHEECGAEYDQLFQPIPMQNFSVKRVNRPWLRHARKRNLYYPKLLRAFAFDACFTTKEIRDKDLSQVISGKRRIYIEGDNAFCQHMVTQSLARYFRPVPTISKKVTAITALFAERTIGIHIRRTDHTEAIRHSPVEAFTHRMDEELRLRPATKFYVATDDQGVKQELIAQYPNSVISPNWELRRDTLQGMQDAVAELYCLGKTCEIWGSHKSTFSIDAAALYDIPLIVIEHQKIP